ncbi:MAG: XisI protein [Spirosomataceae bacterium]
MEKVTAYKTIVQQLVEEIAAMTPSDESSETQVIMDDKRGHYLLFSVGWGNNRREYAPFVHIDVNSDGKVYIQHDGTDLKIALLLVERNIPKSDIVLAFRAPHRRKLMGEFAFS